MNKRMAFGLAAALLVLSMGITGCGGAAATVNNQPPAIPVATVTVAPAVVKIQAGDVLKFTATVSPAGANQAVGWSVSGPGCMGAGCGTIDASGIYIAPVLVPSPPTVTVTATSGADFSKSSSATVTVEPGGSTAELSGQYALLFSGSVGASPVAIVATFTADGNGNLVQNSADITWANAVYTRTLEGSYTVSSDNRGTLSLDTGEAPGPELFFNFALAVDSVSGAGLATRGRLIDITGFGETGTGFFVKQDPTAFSTAAMNGGYAFQLAGSQGISVNVALGRFTASGGSLSSGLIDLGFGGNAFQSNQSFSGTYSVSGSSRGQAALNISGQPNPFGVIFYVVSSGESVWMDASGSGATGMALQQSGAPFNTNSLNGPSVFDAAGFTVAGNDVTVGQIQFDGTGNLTDTSDENDFGAPVSHPSSAGTYTVDPNGLGRGQLTDSCRQSTFYLVSPGTGFLIGGCDAFQAGMFESQNGGPFNNASFSGTYALGTLPLLYVPGSDVAGVLTADGAGNVSGTSTPLGSLTQAFTGTYSVAANGRTTMSITPNPPLPSALIFYFVSPSKAVGLQLSNSGSVVYVIEK
ncbi:MAG TPA: hypothetical protein VFO34_18255 [Candidatus Acidoferrales bacterium]|nr:hypothetical protein [Candidatus Acidoferrales bacterium]